ncbi:helix-turn-helix transcriptional regulator [Acidisoma cellulosilytica]|uniref:Helix-turn-helix transcriptional regulator n=1 Tax=Acidisoma cellulosilyticum TaxID=2802395 RepID=A0A963Z5P3_9PROT|nr:AraC family transcriptional regulator [Acidisoma cellulosilyticum]MCB8882996.1 helix-turn-helix transcriptional regulator [Acidisoma cellulosilyticum]
MSVATEIPTHGIVSQTGNRIRASSASLGWRSVSASYQKEVPFDGAFPAVDDHLLVLHLGGPARVTGAVGGRGVERLIPPGHIFLWPGGESFRIGLRSALDTVHIYLRRKVLEEVGAELGHVGGYDGVELVPCLGEADPFLESLALEVRNSLLNPDPATHLYIEHIAHVMAGRLIRGHSTRAMPTGLPVQGKLSTLQLDRVNDYIDAHLDERIELDALAAAGGLSATWFVRRFKTSTGLPPHQYVLRRRIAQAKRLLVETDQSIASIAFDCGFTHQEHLTRTFRRFTGTTPAAHRKSA